MLKTPDSLLVDEAIAEVKESECKGGSSMEKIDKFDMPIVAVECIGSSSKWLALSSPLNEHTLAVMVEALKMKIDESGAKGEGLGMMGITSI